MIRLTKKDKDLALQLKRANQRLRQLEKSNAGGIARNITEKRALKTKTADLYGKTRSGETKFRTDLTKLTKEQKQRLKAEVQAFLKAKTSTVRGTKTVSDRVRESFNENAKYTPLTKKQADALFKGKEFEEGLKINAFEIISQAYGYREAEILLTKPAKVIEKTAKYFLKQYGKNLKNPEKNSLPSATTYIDLMNGISTENTAELKKSMGIPENV